MKTKKVASKVVSFLLLMIMGVGIMSFPAKAENENDIKLFVDGMQVTADNCEDILGDGTVSYDFEENVLTLKNADLKGYYGVPEFINVIEAHQSLKIHLVGENKIEAHSHELRSIGIDVNGDLSITGDSLVVRGGDIIPQGEKESYIARSRGIEASGKLVISGAKVEAYGGDIQGKIDDAETLGVYVGGSVEIKEGGNLFSFGGTISGNCNDALSCGIYANGTEKSLLYVIIRSGGIMGKGGNVNALNTARSIGAIVRYGDVASAVNESYLEFEGGEAVAANDNASETYAQSNGMNIVGGSFATDGGNIHFNSKKCQGTSVNGDALFVDSALVNGRNFGGSIALWSENIVLNSYGYGFQGTNLRVSSVSGRAIVAKGVIEIRNELEITTPEDASILKDEDGYSIIRTGTETESAMSVVIEPKTHKVLITDASRKLSVIVPTGESINGTYCEQFQIDDFSEYLITEKEGFVFEGWYLDAELTSKFDFDSAITSDVTVYGKWTEISSDSSTPSDDEAKPGDSGDALFFVLLLASAVLTVSLFVRKKRA
ncbi:MAG: hypothetical protein E7614_06180 [Ruminococcaceae bacterium]|nr:hypothetical protein [Oscillospiraceae bacterium]